MSPPALREEMPKAEWGPSDNAGYAPLQSLRDSFPPEGGSEEQQTS